jgi:hypothetical protein
MQILKKNKYKKTQLISTVFLSAGAGGIEPTHTVLETAVLPLYDAPIWFEYFTQNPQ